LFIFCATCVSFTMISRVYSMPYHYTSYTGSQMNLRVLYRYNGREVKKERKEGRKKKDRKEEREEEREKEREKEREGERKRGRKKERKKERERKKEIERNNRREKCEIIVETFRAHNQVECP